MEPGEECDDGNTQAGDGCAANCKVECYFNCNGSWICGTGAGPCAPVPVCGDGVRSSGEACDDGNIYSNDGCASDCHTVELGWLCRVPGRACVPICGDLRVVGREECDDGNVVSGDGCSSACLKEPTHFYCGDGVVSGDEECDDGPANGVPALTTCTANCTFGPFCGDGHIDPGEQCDYGAANGTPGTLHNQLRLHLSVEPRSPRRLEETLRRRDSSTSRSRSGSTAGNRARTIARVARTPLIVGARGLSFHL